MIQWQASGQSHDAWFKNWQARPGIYVVIAGGVGWGDHNQSNVFYVEPGGVVAVAPGSAPDAWRRHENRRVRQQERRAKRADDRPINRVAGLLRAYGDDAIEADDDHSARRHDEGFGHHSTVGVHAVQRRAPLFRAARASFSGRGRRSTSASCSSANHSN